MKSGIRIFVWDKQLLRLKKKINIHKRSDSANPIRSFGGIDSSDLYKKACKIREGIFKAI